jgi:hypothetical protein
MIEDGSISLLSGLGPSIVDRGRDGVTGARSLDISSDSDDVFVHASLAASLPLSNSDASIRVEDWSIFKILIPSVLDDTASDVELRRATGKLSDISLVCISDSNDVLSFPMGPAAKLGGLLSASAKTFRSFSTTKIPEEP